MQMGVCIRHISPDQVNETIGYLAGMEGFVPLGTSVFGNTGMTGLEKFLPIIKDEVLIMHNFTQEKLDELLYRLRSVNASVALKAVVTPTNCSWHFWQLYEELKEEHAQMAKQSRKNHRCECIEKNTIKNKKIIHSHLNLQALSSIIQAL